MNDWFQELNTKRQQWIESTRANNFEHGIRQSTVEKYADPVHFVYELLQNAEDQGATEAHFRLEPSRLVFAHNGRPFTPNDVENITGLGNSEKPDQANKIGRFGIGFKSVFVITERPLIYTTLDNQPFSFAIEDLVVPIALNDPKGFAKIGRTLFILPFLQDRTSELYSALQQKLRSLGADTLLFLRNLKQIRWQAEAEEGTLLCRRNAESSTCVLQEHTGMKGRVDTRPERKYLLYEKFVTLPEADRELSVALAFRVDKDQVDKDQLVAEPGQTTANVYFPTRERTGLKFRLHAPFLLNDSRANIKENDPINACLIQACAHLLAECLMNLRERNLLSADNINCLPIREQDFDGSPFRPLFDAVKQAFRSQALLPTMASSSVSHVKATHAKISDSKPLRNLLGEEQISELFGNGSPVAGPATICWLSDRIQKTVTRELWDYLLHHLEVEEVDSEKFARRVEISFLEEQDDDWMICFYDFLNDLPALWRVRTAQTPGILQNKPIIRLENPHNGKRHVTPFAENGAPNAFLPLKNDTGFPTVNRIIAQDPEAHRFLTSLGLKSPDIVDSVLRFVLPRYQLGRQQFDESEYLADIATIANAVISAQHGERNELRSTLRRTPFIRSEDAAGSRKEWKRPYEVYRRTPELNVWFEGNTNAWFVSPILEACPHWTGIAKFVCADT